MHLFWVRILKASIHMNEMILTWICMQFVHYCCCNLFSFSHLEVLPWGAWHLYGIGCFQSQDKGQHSLNLSKRFHGVVFCKLQRPNGEDEPPIYFSFHNDIAANPQVRGLDTIQVLSLPYHLFEVVWIAPIPTCTHVAQGLLVHKIKCNYEVNQGT